MSNSLLERRASFAAVAGALGVFVGLLLLAPPRPPGFDEAKYLAIGLNVIAGHGARTFLGTFFEPHSPLWPLVMAAPQAWFGIDAFAWAHALNVLAAGAVVAIGAALGWAIRPAAGALTAIGILGSAYLFGLARRTGLDMPAAALSLAYLAVGLAAVRRGSGRLGIVAGALFAAAFLVKEIVVPLAPVPFLAGLAVRLPSAALVRVATAALVTAAIGTSWWWLLFAAETGRVYRLGTPAWTLVPIALLVVGSSILGLAWERPAVASLRNRLREGVEAVLRRGGNRVLGRGAPRSSSGLLAPALAWAPTLAWTLALAWALALAVFFSRAVELRGAPLVDPRQVVFYVGRWIHELIPFVILGGIGTVLALRGRWRSSAVGRRSVMAVLLALICSLPLVLLVVGVGEHPRHYVAQLVILLALGASGWLSLLEDAAARPSMAALGALALAAGSAGVLVVLVYLGDRGTPAVVVGLVAVAVAVIGLLVVGRLVWPGVSQRLPAGGVATAVVAAALVVASAGVVVSKLGRPVAPLDAAKTEVLESLVAWVRNDVPAGSTVAFNAVMGNEAAAQVQDHVRTVQVRDQLSVVFDPAAPLGVRGFRGEATDDWVALLASPNAGSAFSGYQADDLLDDLRRHAVDVWVVSGLTGPDEPLVIDAALTPEHGFVRLATMKVAFGDRAVEANVFRVDRERLAFGREVYVSGAALARLLDQLATQPRAAPAIAEALAARAVIVPAGPAADVLRQRLEQMVRP